MVLSDPQTAEIRCGMLSHGPDRTLNCETFLAINGSLVRPDAISETLRLDWRLFDSERRELFPVCSEGEGTLECEVGALTSALLVRLEISDEESHQTVSRSQEIPIPEARFQISKVEVEEITSSTAEIELLLPNNLRSPGTTILGVLVDEGVTPPPCNRNTPGITLVRDGNEMAWEPMRIPQRGGVSRAYFCIWNGTQSGYADSYLKMKFLGSYKKAEITVEKLPYKK